MQTNTILCILVLTLIMVGIYAQDEHAPYPYQFRNEEYYEIIEKSTAIDKDFPMGTLNETVVKISLQTHDQGTNYVYFVTKSDQGEMFRRISEKGKYFEFAKFEFDTGSDKDYINEFCGVVAEYPWQGYVRYFYSAKTIDGDRCQLFESTLDDNAKMEEIGGTDELNNHSFDKDIIQYSKPIKEKNIILIGRSNEQYGMFHFFRTKMNTDVKPILNEKGDFVKFDNIYVPLTIKGGLSSQLPSPQFELETPPQTNSPDKLTIITNPKDDNITVGIVDIDRVTYSENTVQLDSKDNIPTNATLMNHVLYYTPGQIIVAQVDTNKFYRLHSCEKELDPLFLTQIGPIIPNDGDPLQYLVMNNKDLYQCSAKNCIEITIGDRDQNDDTIDQIFTNDEALKENINLMLSISGKLFILKKNELTLTQLDTDENIQVLSTYGSHFIAKSCNVNNCSLYDIEAFTSKKVPLIYDTSEIIDIAMAINNQNHLYFAAQSKNSMLTMSHINLATIDNCLPSCGINRATCKEGECELHEEIAPKNVVSPYFQNCTENQYGKKCDKYCDATKTCFGYGTCNFNGDCHCNQPGIDEPPYYNSENNCDPSKGCAANVYGEACNKTCSSKTCHDLGGQCQSGECICYSDEKNGYWTGPECRTCKFGYKLSHQCKPFKCFGKDGDAACSGHGTCVGLDQCQCDRGYRGSSCNLASCYGILATSEHVCSGNGKCVEANNCACSRGYAGINCRNWEQEPNNAFNVLALIIAGLVVISNMVLFGFIAVFYSNTTPVHSAWIQLVEQDTDDDDDDDDLNALVQSTQRDSDSETDM